MERNLWLAAHRFSFWFWKLGGTVKKAPCKFSHFLRLCMSVTYISRSKHHYRPFWMNSVWRCRAWAKNIAHSERDYQVRSFISLWSTSTEYEYCDGWKISPRSEAFEWNCSWIEEREALCRCYKKIHLLASWSKFGFGQMLQNIFNILFPVLCCVVLEFHWSTKTKYSCWQKNCLCCNICHMSWRWVERLLSPYAPEINLLMPQKSL